MFLLMGMLSGVAMASTDAGPPGVAVLMFSMGDALGDVAGTPTAAIVAEFKDYSVLPDVSRTEKDIGSAILAVCNPKTRPTGHLGGVSLARGNPMATLYIDIKLESPALA